MVRRGSPVSPKNAAGMQACSEPLHVWEGRHPLAEGDSPSEAPGSPSPLMAVTATSCPQQHLPALLQQIPSLLNNTSIFQWAQERGNQLEDKVPLFHIYLSMPSFQTNFLTGLFSRDGHFKNQLERARHRKIHFSPTDCFQSLLKKEMLGCFI